MCILIASIQLTHPDPSPMVTISPISFSMSLFFKYLFLKFYIFVWLHLVLVVACQVFSCSMQTPSCNMWDLVLNWGSNPGLLHWELGS